MKRHISQSSNNLELGLNQHEVFCRRYCSSTSDLQKEIPLSTKKSFLQVPAVSPPDDTISLRHPEYHGKRCRRPHVFDRKKSYAFKRAVVHADNNKEKFTYIQQDPLYTNLNSLSAVKNNLTNFESENKSKPNNTPKIEVNDNKNKARLNKNNDLFYNENLMGNSFKALDNKMPMVHTALGPNLSWSPTMPKNEIPFRPRLYSSQLPRVSRLSRSLRIRKWVEGKYRSEEMEDEMEAQHEEGTNAGRIRTPLFKRQPKDLANHASEIHLESEKLHQERQERLIPEKHRSKKVSGSTARRRYNQKLRRPSAIIESISSETKTFMKNLEGVNMESTYLSWSNQSQGEGFGCRISALKDKLNAKGQPIALLNLLDTRQYNDALKVAREGHSRVRIDVCLLWASLHGDPGLVKVFLSNGANPEARDAEGFSALHLAAESGSEETVGILLKEGARLLGPASWDNRGEFTPLMLASKSGHVEIISVLMKKGADIDAGLHTRSKTALHYAVRSGSSECVQLLINGGATINPLLLYSETPLHIAVEEGSSDIVDLLLNAGADVRASRGTSKTTCLHISAQGSYYHITHQLLKAGADPNQEDSNGRTPLHLATKSQCYDTVQILLSYKANPNAKDCEGKTPLHSGICKGSRNFECLKLLLESQADPNIPDNVGYTPLHIAALHDSVYCVKLLLKHGADMTKSTQGGVSALNIIMRRTPTVLTHIQESLNNAICFVEHDQQYERDGQVQLDFKVLLAGSEGGPECRLMSCFIHEGQKSFLKHPLCETFLFLKWLRVRSFFVFNLVFYMLLVMALTQYMYMVFPGTSDYYSNMKNRTLFNFFEQEQNGNETKSFRFNFLPKFEIECLNMPPKLQTLRVVLLYFIWIMLSILTIKEGFQVVDSPKSYLSTLDNILVWPVIFGSLIITVNGYHHQTVCPWEYHMAALVILCSWLELLLLIGRFPLFGLYVHMFTQVTKNFSKFLLTYICLINAFSLSFGILFHNQPPFQHRLIRILKTLVMMTGEIDYDEWFYESKRDERILYEGTSHIVFAMFLLFGTIILMNLLVGLAVSDIQGLQKSAGLDRLVRQTQLIAHFETFMFSRWLAIVIPSKLLKMMHTRILLLNSVYCSMFIFNPKNLSSSHLPADVIESIKRVARNRDHFSRRRNAFADFRTLSNTAELSGSNEGDVTRGIDAIRCGLDVLVWETEDRHDEMANLKERLNTITAMLHDLTKTKTDEKIYKHCLLSDKESHFLSCKSDCSDKGKRPCNSSSSGTIVK